MRGDIAVESLFDVQQKTVVINGGHGLYGDCLVDTFAHAGAHVYITGRSIEKLQATAISYQKQGIEVYAFALDLGKPESINSFVETIAQKAINIDVLINNAVSRPMKSMSADISFFDESMHVNVTGVFHLTRSIGNRMISQKSGSIINIASMQGMVGPDASLYENLEMDGFIPDYFFHKAGMINLTRFLASYYGRYGIRCNCISPGGVYSENLPIEFVNRYHQRTMLGRMATPADIAGLCIFLASNASSYITGVNIPVDGGYTSK